MEKFYIVSIELNGSGADILTQNIKERDKKCQEYWTHLIDNKLTGSVIVREDIVNDDRWRVAKYEELSYFDTLDWNKTKVLFQKEYHPRMMKSKADLEKQIGRIAANHPNHRLYNKAQNLVLLYNQNISEHQENIHYWNEWRKLNRDPEMKGQADAMLRKIHDTTYHRNWYAKKTKK